MSCIRDLLALFGSIAVGWFLFFWNRYTERGMTLGAFAGLILVGVVIYGLRSEAARKERMKSALDKQQTRIIYLETAIRQMGGDKL